MNTINWDDFVEKYKPEINKEDAPYGGYMYETYGEDIKYVVNIANSDKNQHVWTIVDCEDEESWIFPGYHYVNRIGYIITTIPWVSEDLQVNDNEMCTVEEAIDYCISFGETQFKIGFDKNDVTLHFNENLDTTFDGEMTIGRAKYTAIDYFEDRLEIESTEFDDDIHDYYSQLK